MLPPAVTTEDIFARSAVLHSVYMIVSFLRSSCATRRRKVKNMYQSNDYIFYLFGIFSPFHKCVRKSWVPVLVNRNWHLWLHLKKSNRLIAQLDESISILHNQTQVSEAVNKNLWAESLFANTEQLHSNILSTVFYFWQPLKHFLCTRDVPGH